MCFSAAPAVPEAPQYEWADLKTGAIVDPGTKGAVRRVKPPKYGPADSILGDLWHADDSNSVGNAGSPGENAGESAAAL